MVNLPVKFDILDERLPLKIDSSEELLPVKINSTEERLPLKFQSVVREPARLQAKEVAPSTEAQTVTPDGNFDGLSEVSVAAVALQSKTVTPSSEEQTITPDSGFLGLREVTVEAAAGGSGKPSKLSYVKTYSTNGVYLYRYLRNDSSFHSTSFRTTEAEVTMEVGDVVLVTYNKTYNIKNTQGVNTSNPRITVTGGELQTLLSAGYTSGDYHYMRYTWAVALESETVSIKVEN